MTKAIFRPHRGFIIWSKLPDGSMTDALFLGAGRWSAAGGSFILFFIH
ncbi:hypothetical protein [Paenibacillus sp. cl141a]|nr:hypothetical protein [Paenibacillus sp. cl141a]